jgi:curved DNA-binding protein
MAPPDHYATLGVSRTADTATITKAFRKLARKSHPDLNKDKHASARFKAVAEAYAVLKNPEKRAAYDHPPEPEPARAQPRQRHATVDDSDLADLLAAFTRGTRTGNTGGHSTPQPGRSHEHTVPLSLRHAHIGTTLRVNVPDPTGAPGSRSLDVTIPPGTADGQTMRLRGQGEPGHNGGPAGDIYLHMALQPDPVFSVHGQDLFMDLTLAPWQAVLGADVEVPTLDGPVLLTVPPGTRAGRKLRLRGRGLAHGSGARGDLYALARLDVPASPSAEEQALYRSLAEAASARLVTPAT